MMKIPDVIHRVTGAGIELQVDSGKLLFHPKSAATPAIIETLREYKWQIIVYLVWQGLASVSLYNNPPECHNPFTPHELHEYPWECNPNSCYCYKVYGYPYLCQGVPCRWIWPQNITKEKTMEDQQ